jgi:hypothetical protein
VQRGDVLTVVGSTVSTTRVAADFGVADRVTDVTDMLVVATGIVAGALIGLPALDIGGVEIGLSLPVGVLLGGLVCGWLRSVRPGLFGRVPGPTLWIFESIGLAGFVAVVGLNAGSGLRAVACRRAVVSLVLAGVLTVSAIALLVGVLVGRWVFKMHPGVLLGVCAGGLHGHAGACGDPGNRPQRGAVDRLWRGLRRGQRVPGHLGHRDRGAAGLSGGRRRPEVMTWDIWQWVVDTLRAYPELAIFLALAVGFLDRAEETRRLSASVT